ncbi:amidoligase family protein [Amphritea pacifica]|uniref:amidoligase family protein n=1 Tax=Amphritea pacifica TaxID=2811233 RepID=UPI00196381B3|nr:amidoligase family protein [Amphritea pacifica]MBN1007437.1 amidoligase family protein [Amphritea pacifica]
MYQTQSFRSPSCTMTSKGAERKVGFELEFSGLTLQQTTEIVRKTLNGTLEHQTAAQTVIHCADLGAFNIELDWNYLKEKAASDKDQPWLELLSDAASLLVPVEVVCPPIVLSQLDRLDQLVVQLRHAGAIGTEESMIAAYGVHINSEIPSLDAATLFDYLRAFSLLQWWLVEAHAVNTTRKISPYIDLYPEKYIKQLLSRDHPDMEMIFSDYLEHNASRNRALDLLPLLAEIDEDRVRRCIDDPKIKARPTFHYRMPNCNIEHENWSLALSWNTWWVVEQLASQPDYLNELSAAFLAAEQPLMGVSRKLWTEYIDQWLKNHALA